MFKVSLQLQLEKHSMVSKENLQLCVVYLTERQEQIDELVRTKPLSMENIHKLSPYSTKYVIPYNQKKAKQLGLVLYNLSNRQGGSEEAKALEDSLISVGCDVLKLEWSDIRELTSIVESSLESRVKECSLLIVCIMAHGSRGVIYGSEGKSLAVNEILQVLDHILPSTIPMVCYYYAEFQCKFL